MRARSSPHIKAVLPLFRGIFGGARGTRTPGSWACLARLAEAKHAPGEDDGDLLAALVRGHGGRVGKRFFHRGLLSDMPTTAFAWRPARCLAGLVLFVLLLLTPRKFEMAVKLPKAAQVVREGIEQTLSHMAFPREPRRLLLRPSPTAQASGAGGSSGELFIECAQLDGHYLNIYLSFNANQARTGHITNVR